MVETVKTPWHLWAVGVLALLWNGFGCVDFVMSTTQAETWLAQMGMTEAQIAYFNSMPAWTFVAWGVGVFGGAIGAILLLVRRQWAFAVFVLSFLGWLASVVYAFLLSDGMAAMGEHWPMQFVIGAVCLFLVWYAWRSKTRGVLR